MADTSRDGDSWLIYLLNVGQRRVQRWIQTRTGENGVTAAQYGLLLFLGRRDGALMGEAGTALDLGPSALSGLVDRLAAAGLVQRRPDPHDGRAWHLWLTAAGHQALAQARAGLTELNALLVDGFTADDIATVSRWLASLQDKFPRGENE